MALRYEYDTSPRKVEPEYNPSKKQKSSQKATRKTSNKEVKNQIVKKAKEQAKLKKEQQIKQRRMVIYVFIAFGILLAISYRNSLINENFAKVRDMKEELALVEKEKEQLQVNIESSLNLKNLEQSAKEVLGMQRLDNSQKIYVNLPKKDYIQPASEEVVVKNDKNWLEKLIEKIMGK